MNLLPVIKPFVLCVTFKSTQILSEIRQVQLLKILHLAHHLFFVILITASSNFDSVRHYEACWMSFCFLLTLLVSTPHVTYVTCRV